MEREVISSTYARFQPIIFGSLGLTFTLPIIFVIKEPALLLFDVIFLFLVIQGFRLDKVSVGYKKIYIKQFFKSEKGYFTDDIVAINKLGFNQEYEIKFSNGDNYRFCGQWFDYFPNPFRDCSAYYLERIKELAG